MRLNPKQTSAGSYHSERYAPDGRREKQPRMGEPYDPYAPSAAASADGGIARSSFAGYIPSESSPLVSPYPRFSNPSSELRGIGSDYLQNDINLSRLGPYSVEDAVVGSRVVSEPNIKGYSPLDDPVLRTKRDTSLAVNPDISSERPIPKTNPEAPVDSNVLFVDGLPKDCTRREVGHLFRPFIGYKDIRVVHKEPRRSGDKAMVLCFVEFTDSKCALTAMEALQGYKFDDKKPDSRTLKIQFAHFPFRPVADNGTTT